MINDIFQCINNIADIENGLFSVISFNDGSIHKNTLGYFFHGKLYMRRVIGPYGDTGNGAAYTFRIMFDIHE
jgi:hypothetical protein